MSWPGGGAGGGSTGSLSLSPTALAPGDNVIVPVAVFSDGMQVAGGAFVVHVESGAVNGWGNGAGSGLWSNTANWTGGVLPQNGDKVARFSGATSGGTVTLDASASVEEIDFRQQRRRRLHDRGLARSDAHACPRPTVRRASAWSTSSPAATRFPLRWSWPRRETS